MNSMDIRLIFSAFEGSRSISKEDAEKKEYYTVSFYLYPDDKKKFQGFGLDEIDILIDSVFVKYSNGEKHIVMQESGFDIFKKFYSPVKYGDNYIPQNGKIKIPNEITNIEFTFNVKICEKATSKLIKKHIVELDMERKESKSIFFLLD